MPCHFRLNIALINELPLLNLQCGFYQFTLLKSCRVYTCRWSVVRKKRLSDCMLRRLVGQIRNCGILWRHYLPDRSRILSLDSFSFAKFSLYSHMCAPFSLWFRLCVLVLLGCPILYYLLLSRNQHKLFTDDNIQNQIGFIYSMYSPECWYWELTEMTRKFVLAAAIMLYEVKSLSQIVGALIVTIIFIIAHTAYLPYLRSSTDFLQSLCMMAVLVTLIFAIKSKYATEKVNDGAPLQPSDEAPSVWWILVPLGLIILYTWYLVIGAMFKLCLVRSGIKKSQANVGFELGLNGQFQG